MCVDLVLIVVGVVKMTEIYPVLQLKDGIGHVNALLWGREWRDELGDIGIEKIQVGLR